MVTLLKKRSKRGGKARDVHQDNEAVAEVFPHCGSRGFKLWISTQHALFDRGARGIAAKSKCVRHAEDLGDNPHLYTSPEEGLIQHKFKG